MNIHLTRRYIFPASHRLHTAALSTERNASIYGKCNNPHGHGHNYAVEITVRGPIDPVTGMVINLGVLDPLVHEAVVSRYDHVNLNMLPEFQRSVPTTENLCREIHNRLKERLQGVQLVQVRIEETRKNVFVYTESGKVAS